MNQARMSAVMVVALGGAAHAGGFERSDQSVAVLFEKGRYLELGGVYGIPEASGVATNLTPTPGAKSGDIAESFVNIRAAYKADIDESFSFAVIYDQPYGADVKYPTSSYFASNSTADLKTHALTGLLQYNLPENLGLAGGHFSLYGGPRIQFVDASASIPFFAGYSVSAEHDISPGFLAGAAWERPDLGMRVSLTYTSQINSDLETTETFARGALRGTYDTTTALDTPSSLTLEAQTGINPKTLLYGSVRYVPWSNFEVTPPVYGRATGGVPLAFFEDDRTTFRLGLGRRINDSWAVFGEVGYEETTGSPTTNLTPIDGFISGTAGVSYTYDNVRTTLGLRYADVGDADTILGGRSPAGEFSDSSLLAIGLRVGIHLN